MCLMLSMLSAGVRWWGEVHISQLRTNTPVALLQAVVLQWLGCSHHVHRWPMISIAWPIVLWQAVQTDVVVNTLLLFINAATACKSLCFTVDMKIHVTAPVILPTCVHLDRFLCMIWGHVGRQFQLIIWDETPSQNGWVRSRVTHKCLWDQTTTYSSPSSTLQMTASTVKRAG